MLDTVHGGGPGRNEIISQLEAAKNVAFQVYYKASRKSQSSSAEIQAAKAKWQAAERAYDEFPGAPRQTRHGLGNASALKYHPI